MCSEGQSYGEHDVEAGESHKVVHAPLNNEPGNCENNCDVIRTIVMSLKKTTRKMSLITRVGSKLLFGLAYIIVVN